jgi:hypothetical protein
LAAASRPTVRRGAAELDQVADPQSPLRWTCKSTRELAETLTAQGHRVSDDTVGRLPREQGYRLQRTVKTVDDTQHPDRDAQLRYRNEQARAHLAAGQPVVSVDTKKKELVGRFAALARFAAETGLAVTVCHFPPGTSKWNRSEAHSPKPIGAGAWVLDGRGDP